MAPHAQHIKGRSLIHITSSMIVLTVGSATVATGGMTNNRDGNVVQSRNLAPTLIILVLDRDTAGGTDA